MLKNHRILTIFFTIVFVLPATSVNSVSSQSATPTAQTDSLNVQFDVPLGALPGDPAFMGMARLIIPPGSGIAGGSIPGYRLFFIESGGVIVTSSRPMTVWRDAQPERTENIEIGDSIGVSAGDLLLAPGSPPESIENIAEIAAVILDIVVWPSIEENVRPFLTDNGVVFDPLAFGEISPLPKSPGRLMLQDHIIPLGATAEIDAENGPTVLTVQTGILGIAAEGDGVTYSRAASNNPGSVPGRLKSLRSGTEALLTAGGAATIQINTNGQVRNLGRSDVVVLELRILHDQPSS